MPTTGGRAMEPACCNLVPADLRIAPDYVPGALLVNRMSGTWRLVEHRFDMTYTVDFAAVSTVGLETSPVAPALAGLRANEARYFNTRYGHAFTTEPAGEVPELVEWVHRILREDRGLVIASRPLEATQFQVENVKWTYVFYESGLSINVLYSIDDAGKRAVGFKLSDGMEVPDELAPKFKFVRQKSKLAGTIRGSYFVIKGQY